MSEKNHHTHAPRITSIHGVLLPPKKRHRADKYITIRFVIVGVIPSKKNMIWADSNLNVILKKLYSFTVVRDCVNWLRENHKAFVRNSKKYTDWVEGTTPIIMKQLSVEAARYAKHDLIFPLNNVTIRVYHYWKDNVERDNSNKYDSIIDLLVACKVIANDAWQVVGRNESESECYRNEILNHITTIDVTQGVAT